MTEFWKSNPRHFCDFCKCWIADNRPSRDFHERGKKHKENVEKKIATLRKKGVKDAQAKSDMEGYLKDMEQAANKAFAKDLQNNPSLAAQYGVEIDTPAPVEMTCEPPPVNSRQQKKSKTKIGPNFPTKAERESSQDTPADGATAAGSYHATPGGGYHNYIAGNTATPGGGYQDYTAGNTATPGGGYPAPPSSDPAKSWSEHKSDEGYTYYWNFVTGETTWTKPEGFDSPVVTVPGDVTTRGVATGEVTTEDVSTGNAEEDESSASDSDEAAGEQPGETDAQIPTSSTDTSSTAADTTSSVVPETPVIPLPPTTSETPESSSEIPVPAEPEPQIPTVATPSAAAAAKLTKKRSAYGGWESIPEPVADRPVDFQLPADESAKNFEEKKVVVTREAKVKFREKKVDTLGAEFVAFKKRKLNQSGMRRRNSRPKDSE